MMIKYVIKVLSTNSIMPKIIKGGTSEKLNLLSFYWDEDVGDITKLCDNGVETFT